jgi:predicted DNA-binding protein with PD1-like motif
MKYAEAQMGRIFILRLEDGDIVHEAIEQLARDHSIQAAAVILLGGADDGSKLVVGPELDRVFPIHPMELVLEGVHEAAGIGTIYPDENGNPTLHMHMACGRDGSSRTGCVRRGVKTWQILEGVLFELKGTNCFRKFDERIGFRMLYHPKTGENH